MREQGPEHSDESKDLAKQSYQNDRPMSEWITCRNGVADSVDAHNQFPHTARPPGNSLEPFQPIGKTLLGKPRPMFPKSNYRCRQSTV